MMNTVSLEQLYRSIQELAVAYKKVDVVKLAESLGLKVFLAEDGISDFNAEIVYDEDDQAFEILVNAKHSYTRQRFSIAHEIAHFILHRDQLIDMKKISRGPKNGDNYKTEKEADKLAEEILMPEELIKQYCDELKVNADSEIDTDVIRMLAQKFEVSPIVTAIRLRNLGYIVSLSYVA
jgi:Zn-dependent peptidase ImmA (M78 family)